ncbi:MAG: hypothetical protein WED33_02795 [Bacteroidia bacterium]
MKIRIICSILGVLLNYSVIAQRETNPTDSLFVTGKVKNPSIFTLTSLDTFPKVPIKAPIIFNQKGEARDTMRGLFGIPIKALLQSIQFDYNKPRELNEYYFVFSASDGYRVVFSWNEIYSTDAGNNFFIVTEIDGKKLIELEQRIFFVSTNDLKRGNRQIKGLKTIEIRQID